MSIRRRRPSYARNDPRDIDSAMRRDTAGTAIGNFMEWYDFGVYGYIATTIAQVFYPGDSVSAVHLHRHLQHAGGGVRGAAAWRVRPWPAR